MSRIREKQALKRYVRALESGHIDVYGALKGGRIDVYGADKWSEAGGALSAFSEAGKGIGDIVEAQQAARSAADKARAIDNARKAMVDAKANMAKVDLVEKDKNGPAHRDAQKTIIDVQAALDKLVGGDSGGDSSGGKNVKPASGFALPHWGWYALGGLGALGVGIIGYKLLSKKGKR